MNGGPKWWQISKTLKNRKKVTFCSNRKVFSLKFLSQCVLMVMYANELHKGKKAIIPKPHFIDIQNKEITHVYKYWPNERK